MAAVPVPVTVKIRTGWDGASVNAVEVARAAEQAGRRGGGAPRPDAGAGLRRHRRLGRDPRREAGGPIPVLGSGDVWSAADALRMRAETGCDAVLVARGALGNPWIFRELRAHELGLPNPPPPTRDEWAEVILLHVRLQIEHRRRQRSGEGDLEVERHAVRELRKQILWYTRGRRGGAHFRRDAGRLETAADVARLIDLHFPPGADAFELEPGDRPAEAAE